MHCCSSDPLSIRLLGSSFPPHNFFHFYFFIILHCKFKLTHSCTNASVHRYPWVLLPMAFKRVFDLRTPSYLAGKKRAGKKRQFSSAAERFEPWTYHLPLPEGFVTFPKVVVSHPRPPLPRPRCTTLTQKKKKKEKKRAFDLLMILLQQSYIVTTKMEIWKSLYTPPTCKPTNRLSSTLSYIYPSGPSAVTAYKRVMYSNLSKESLDQTSL